MEEHSGFEALGTIAQKQQDVASASTITLGEGNLFYVTGTTNISDIAVADTIQGRIIYLCFEGVLTIDNNNMYIAGGSFTTSNADVICLGCFGNVWVEISRSVNS